MKQFEWYDIKCALTHNLDVCEHCKKCGEFPNVRMEMAEYVECLEKALDKACEELHYYENKISNCYDTSQSVYTKEEWKEYLLESENK